MSGKAVLKMIIHDMTPLFAQCSKELSQPVGRNRPPGRIPPDGFGPSFQAAHYASLMSPTRVQAVARMAGRRPESGVCGRNPDCASQAPLHPGYAGYELRWLRSA